MEWRNLEQEENSLLVWNDCTEDHRRWQSLLKTPYHPCQIIPSVIPLLPGGDHRNNKIITLLRGQPVSPHICPCRESVGELDDDDALRRVRFGTSQDASCVKQPFLFPFQGKSSGDHAGSYELDEGHNHTAKKPKEELKGAHLSYNN